jgi:hypothetical protein
MTNFTTPQKTQSRQQYQFDEYRNITKNSYLPLNKELWTLSSRCSDSSGNLIEDSELHHALQDNFIKSSKQFHGVEQNLSIHNDNMKIEGNWYHGKFHTMFQRHAKNPGLVNVDTMSTYKVFRNNFRDILDYASQWSDVVCIFNFVSELRGYGISCGFNEIAETIRNDDLDHILDKWTVHDRYYEGHGASKKTKMCAIYLYR